MKFEPLEIVLETDEEVEVVRNALNKEIKQIFLRNLGDKYKKTFLKQLKTKVISMNTFEEAKFIWGLLNWNYWENYKLWIDLDKLLEEIGVDTCDMSKSLY